MVPAAVTQRPWTVALGSLVLIWTLWFLIPSRPVVRGLPSPRVQVTSSDGNTEKWAQQPSTSPEDRTLILYAYAHNDNATTNLKFFLKHGLHGGADFVFIFNGETDSEKLLPDLPNVKYVKRENKCFDLGAFAEILTGGNLWKKYKRFITMNASIRGPFMPHWGTGCWSDMYLNKVTEITKLVGMTGNCWPRFHVQSMIWATDHIGMSLLLNPPHNLTRPADKQASGINRCFEGWLEAVEAEIGSTGIILDAGYDVDTMMAIYHAFDNGYSANCDPDFGNGDYLWEKHYHGTNIHPYETLFIKSNRDVDYVMIDKYTEWQNGSGYSSWDHCLRH